MAERKPTENAGTIDFSDGGSAIITLDDLNGDHYLGTQEGENLTRELHRVYYFPYGVAGAENPLEEYAIDATHASLFVSYNASMLYHVHGVGTLERAVKIAYLRLLAVKHGLVSPQFDPKAYHVKYHETELIDEAATIAFTKSKNAIVPADMKAVLTEAVSKSLRNFFTDRVCAVAFVFRARGHHYTQNYQELYDRVWEKCRYKTADLQLPWDDIAVAAFHAIFPEILDAFWKQSVVTFKCNGALAKRFDVAPAGAAGPFVIKQGLQDLLMVAPGIRNRLEDSVAYLDSLIEELLEHRFNGSVNANYYGARKVAINEKRLGAIAATIKAAVDNLTDDAPIGKSPALKRIADNAPITGAVLGKGIGQIASRPEVTDALMLKSE